MRTTLLPRTWGKTGLTKLPGSVPYQSWAMKQDIRKLTTQNYKAQLAASKLLCTALINELRKQTLTVGQRDAIAQQWEKALRESYAFQFMLDRLEQEERHGREDGEPCDSATLN